MATGITPHEQSGSGIPNNDAFTMGNNPLPPKFLSTDAGDITTERIPAIKNPNKRYGDISFVRFHNSIRKFSVKLIIHNNINNENYILNINHTIHI